jgi:hypothetical protein
VRDHLAFARHESTASVLPKLTPERTIDLTNTPPAQLSALPMSRHREA